MHMKTDKNILIKPISSHFLITFSLIPPLLTVAGELLRFALGRGLAGMPQGHAASQHPPEPAGVRADRHQVPRAT